MLYQVIAPKEVPSFEAWLKSVNDIATYQTTMSAEQANNTVSCPARMGAMLRQLARLLREQCEALKRIG